MKNLARLREHLRISKDATQSQDARESALAEADRILEAEFSHDETRTAIYAELRANRFNADGSYAYRWIRAVYDTYFVYEEEVESSEKLFRRDYSIDANGVVTLGEPVEVRIEYSPVTGETAPTAITEAERVTESFIELKERAIADDGTMLIKICDEGWGSSGYYSKEVIERDIPKLFPKGTHMMANHQTAAQEAEQPEGRIQDLAAEFIEDPKFLESGPDGPAAYVRVKPFADYAPMLEDKAAAIGVSLNGGGNFSIGEAEGRTGRIVDEITVGKSVDFVTKAGRGGAIISLQEARRNKENPQIDSQPRKVVEAATADAATKMEGDSNVKDEEATQLRESNTKLQAKLIEREAKDVAGATLKAIDMPQAARERLAEAMAKQPVTAGEGADRVLDSEKFAEAVREAATKELEFAQAAYGYGTGQVTGCGSGETNTLKENQTPPSIAAVRGRMGL